MLARCGRLVFLLLVLATAPASAQRVPDAFRDPEDGRFDLSEHLLTRRGLLPMPILITEPALGYGAGLALTYFSQSLAEGAREGRDFAIPTIAGGAGFATAGGSYGGALFYFQPYRHDRFRFLAALGGASLDLDFFGFDPEGPLSDQPIAYTIKTLFTGGRAQARLGDTDLFIGAHYSYLSTETSFATPPPEIPDQHLDVDVAGLGVGLEYDTRDNLLNALRGMDVTANATWYGPSVGGDESFSKYSVQGLFYGQPTTQWGYGLRVSSGFATGDPPFFEKPSLAMRGLPDTKYLNDVTVLAEAELRYSIDSRWTVLAFGGSGRVAETWGDIPGASGIGAGGLGFRYLLARRLGLGSGLDFALGPGSEFAFYIQMGSAWR